ncbi:hypothetical protein PIB30_046462 [Stylosanthes scabra]|uniref:Peptidase A1 domain-containing protein n=1 Tax=Stylosanthes scabra TaxID=79078 RepID=A0ABU6SGB3_9FABA|nr:hypothetical protein [Stylosanthes scabra]
MTLLGDLVLSNKLIVYDLENMAIGWVDYNSVAVSQAHITMDPFPWTANHTKWICTFQRKQDFIDVVEVNSKAMKLVTTMRSCLNLIGGPFY